MTSGSKLTTHPCEYCGTMLDENDEVESNIPACGPRMAHYAAQCREYVYAALRSYKAELATTKARLDGTTAAIPSIVAGRVAAERASIVAKLRAKAVESDAFKNAMQGYDRTVHAAQSLAYHNAAEAIEKGHDLLATPKETTDAAAK